MDTDSVITLLLFLAFFVLPSIFRQIRARKKKSGAAPVKQSRNNTLFSRIREQFQKFIKELEEQAQQSKQQQRQEVEGPGEDFWDSLGKEEPAQDAYSHGVEDAVTEPEVPQVTEPFTQPPSVPDLNISADTGMTSAGISQRNARMRATFRQHPLQNAVVWSEILGKPKALRDE